MGARKYRVDQWFIEEAGDRDEFYDVESLNELVDNDMISGSEEGFMRGYLEADSGGANVISKPIVMTVQMQDCQDEG